MPAQASGSQSALWGTGPTRQCGLINMTRGFFFGGDVVWVCCFGGKEGVLGMAMLKAVIHICIVFYCFGNCYFK